MATQTAPVTGSVGLRALAWERVYLHPNPRFYDMGFLDGLYRDPSRYRWIRAASPYRRGYFAGRKARREGK